MYLNLSNFRGRTSAGGGTSLGPKTRTSVRWGYWQNFRPMGGPPSPPPEKNPVFHQGNGIIIQPIIYFYYFNSGIGLGLPMVAKILVLTEYFEENFNTANSIGFTGGAIGMIILAPAADFLISRFGWRGALMISGAVSFNICVAGQVMIHSPEESSKCYTILTDNDNDKSKTDIGTERKLDDWKTNGSHCDRKADYHKINLSSQNVLKCCCVVKDVDVVDNKDSFCKTLWERLGFITLAHEPGLILYHVAFALQELAVSGWMLFLFTYTISLGYDKQIATFLSSTGGLGTLIGRLFSGPCADKGLCSHRLQIGIFALGGCTCLSLYPFTSVYWHLVLISLMTGLFVGTTTPIYVSLLKEMFPDSSLDFSGSVSLQYTMRGLGMLCGGPLTGKRKVDVLSPHHSICIGPNTASNNAVT